MKLADFLTAHGLTVPAFAREAGVAHTTVYRILSGMQVPGPQTRRKIAFTTRGLVTERDLLREAAEVAAVAAPLEAAAC